MAVDGVVSRKHMLVKPRVKWFEIESGFDSYNSKTALDSADNSISADRKRFLELRADKLYKHDVELFNKHQERSSNRSNATWIRTVLRSGTIADKMAAHTLLLQDSALHNHSSLEHLTKMVDPKGKRECIMAADTLKDVFLGDLLPPDRKLQAFDNHPLKALLEANGSDAADRALLLAHFERLLKQSYAEYVLALNKMAHDGLEATKRKGIRNMFLLLTGHPEQEQALLRNLVNKLGDPSQKVASYTSLCLCQLVDQHPRMRAIVTSEVERLLFRTNVSNKACYYAACFLNQMILEKDGEGDGVLGAKLIVIYLALFKAHTKRGDVDSRMMSALLTGVNRAFPYATLDTDVVAEQTDAIYKIIHRVTFNISIQALTLIFHILSSKDHFNDRFYCALYRKILDPGLKDSSKRAMFLNLLYKTLKSDCIEARVYAFVKRILQVAAGQSPTVVCGLLLMISEVVKCGHLRNLLTPKEIGFRDGDDDDDDEEERFSDASDDEADNLQVPASKKSTVSVPADGLSWVHRANAVSKARDVVGSRSDAAYDPLHRNPTYARAMSASAWELLNLTRHYHPSVVLFARTLVDAKPIVYSGDPLQDFSLIRFLDRFVFRNSKKPDSKSSLVQHSVLGRRKSYTPNGARALAVNSNDYMNFGEDRVPVDELFFHRYFTDRREAAKNATVGELDEDADDVESVGSDEFDELLDRIEPGDMSKELDFASELKNRTAAKKNKRKKKGAESDSDDDDEEEDEPEFDDFGDAFKDYSEEIREAKISALEDDDFEDESSNDDDGGGGKLGRRARTKAKSKTRTKDFSDDDDEDDEFDFDAPRKKKSKKHDFDFDDPSKLFASAEEFASVLEDNENAEIDTIGVDAMSNKDNAHAKQLRWEQDRDRWVRGQDWKSRKNRRTEAPKRAAKRRRLTTTMKASSKKLLKRF